MTAFATAFAPLRLETRATVALAVPLVLTELAYMAMILTDVVMMGRIGPEAIAAGSLAGHFYAFLEFFALGVLGAVAPILAQHLGARRFRMVRRAVRQGFWVAIAVAVPCGAVIWHAGPILVALGQDPELALSCQSYLRAMVFGFLPGLWILVLSGFLAAHERPRATLVVVVVGIGFNALADYALMFGHFGFPRLGLVGAGVATAAVSSFMFAALLGFVLVDRRLRRYRLWGRFWRSDWQQFVEIVRLGLPIGVSQLAEIGLFLAAALLMGLLGTTALAAHAIAIQCITVPFTVSHGIGQAATVRVGRAVGAGDADAAVRAGWIAMALALVMALVPAVAFLLFGKQIAGWFLDPARAENQAAITLAASFLVIAALFEFFDATVVCAAGVLRGLKDTRGPMMIALAGYFGIGLPAAALFGVHLELGGLAIWMSLAAALAAVAAMLVTRFVRQARRLEELPVRA